MAKFMDQIKKQLGPVVDFFKGIPDWPTYRKIGVGMMVLGLLPLIIGILLY